MKNLEFYFKDYWDFWESPGIKQWIMELEISAKCRGKVMEFDKRVIHLSKTAQVRKNFVRPQLKRCELSEIRITEAFYLFACAGP